MTGPNGIYVTGYATPPVAKIDDAPDAPQPLYSKAVYHGQTVRVLRLIEQTSIDDTTGDATITVWQRMEDRDSFARQLGVRTGVLMMALLFTLALVVWFGVRFGLRPVTDLQDAISIRSADDLSAIRRPIPTELMGIVSTLNRLFGQVESSIAAHQAFISDASHQLRNPSAAVQSMAEAVRDAKDDTERERRIAELIKAARSTARVAEQLLSLDRLRHSELLSRVEPFDLSKLVSELCGDFAGVCLVDGTDFELVDVSHCVMADRVFIAEAKRSAR